MEIFCDSCNIKLKIRNESLPTGQPLNVKCPKCKSNICVDQDSNRDQQYSPSKASNDEQPFSLDHTENLPPNQSKEIPTMEMSMDEFCDFLDDGLQRALICVHNQEDLSLLKSTLKELGYWSNTGKDSQDALEKMRFNHYDLLILSEGFGDSPLSANPVLNYIRTMPIATRRNIFVVLIGPQFRTYDNMTALSESVNLVINEKDTSKISSVLRSSISEYERFYAVFNEVLKSVGHS